jgi:hypothetical protein
MLALFMVMLIVVVFLSSSYLMRPALTNKGRVRYTVALEVRLLSSKVIGQVFGLKKFLKGEAS